MGRPLHHCTALYSLSDHHGNRYVVIKNIQAVNWDKVAEEVRPKAGGKIDLGV